MPQLPNPELWVRLQSRLDIQLRFGLFQIG